MRRSITTLTIAAAGVLLIAACGSSGSKTSTKPPTTASSGSSSTAAEPVKLTGLVNDKGTQDISSMGMAPTVSISANDHFFQPTFVKVDPGASVKVSLKNAGATEHTFTIDSLGINQTLQPGATATVTVKVPATGMVAFHCNFHVALGMQGAFFTSATGASGAAGAGAATTSPTTAPATSATTGSSGGGSGGYGY
jgi:plastocyanin